jgi:uncharacterized membrane protein
MKASLHRAVLSETMSVGSIWTTSRIYSACTSSRQIRRIVLAGFVAFVAVACEADPAAPPAHEAVPFSPRFEVGPGGTVIIAEDLHGSGLGESSMAYAINDADQITGWRGKPGAEEAFLWSPSSGWTTMASAGYAPYTSSGNDINGQGRVVGTASKHAALWTSPGSFQPLTVPLRTKADAAMAINGWGAAVGWALGSNGSYPIRWDGTGAASGLELTQEGSYLPIGIANDINDQHEVVGSGGMRAGRPFYWKRGSPWIDPTFTELGLLRGDTHGSAAAINNAGTIVGYSGWKQAVRWADRNASAQPLGMLTGHDWSEANDINESDVIAGTSGIAGTGPYSAFRRPPGGVMGALTLNGAASTAAEGVNEAGHVVGFAKLEGGVSHAVVWWIYEADRIVSPRLQQPADPAASGLVTIDVLSDDRFDALQVDPRTVTLGNDEGEDTRVASLSGRLAVAKVDANGDRLTDLRLSFSARELVTNGDMVKQHTAKLVLKGALRDRTKAVRGTCTVTATW